MRVQFSGHQLRLIRKRKCLRQADIAGALNVSIAAVSAWERGIAQPSAVHYSQMVAAYGCTARDLVNAVRSGVIPEGGRARVFRLFAPGTMP